MEKVKELNITRLYVYNHFHRRLIWSFCILVKRWTKQNPQDLYYKPATHHTLSSIPISIKIISAANIESS